MKRVLWVGIVLLMALAFWVYPPLRVRALVAVGRSPQCPMARAVEAPDHARELLHYKDSILSHSKLVEKDGRGFHLWDTPHGRFWIPEGDDWVLPFNLAEQEAKIYGTGERAVRAGDIVLDCGANVGVFTRVALDAGAKQVIAIEPAPENIECLRRNFPAETAAGRVVIYPKGVWDKDDILTLNVDPHNTAADSFIIQRQGSYQVQQVPLTTIDKLMDELKLERVDYVKMDIEGAEPKALDGARRTLATFHPRLSISAYHAPDHPVAIPRAVRAAWPGYRMECGPCAEANFGVRPDVLYFW